MTTKRIIADIPTYLAVWLKVEAAKQGRTMREILIDLLGQEMQKAAPAAVKTDA